MQIHFKECKNFSTLYFQKCNQSVACPYHNTASKTCGVRMVFIGLPVSACVLIQGHKGILSTLQQHARRFVKLRDHISYERLEMFTASRDKCTSGGVY